MREALQINQAATRPFVFIQAINHLSTDGNSKVNIELNNQGNLPGRLLYVSGATWIDRQKTIGGNHQVRHILYPNKTIIHAIIQTGKDLFKVVNKGEKQLKFGFCVLYESFASGDNRRWFAESWFYYDTKLKKIMVWKRDETVTSLKQTNIKIENIIPEKFFESKKPAWKSAE